MHNGTRLKVLTLTLFSLGFLSCSTRAPVSQAKDDGRVSTRGSGEGAAAVTRIGRGSEKGARREAPAPASPAVEEKASTTPQVGYAVLFGRSAEARSLPPAAASGEAGEINELNDEIDRPIVAAPGFKLEDATIRGGQRLSTKALEALPSSTSFEGLADTDNGAGLVNPSDSNGAVGPNHYVEVVNTRVRVYDKSGNPLTPPFRQSSLFASIGGICATGDAGDPIVLYDKLADRWQVSQFAFTAINAPPYHQCIAESINGDPAGKYYLYDFQLPSNNFPDYPKLATWPDAYYLSTRQFLNGGPFNGEGAIAFDRKKMLVGDPTATLIYFSLSNGGNGLSFSSSGMLPLDFDGLLPPAPGTPNIFAIYTAAIFGDPQGDALRLFDFHVDFGTPGNSTFTERSESALPVAAFDPLNPPGRADIEQPPPANAGDNLDSIGDRLMYRFQYRNHDGIESLVAVHTVNVGVHLTTRFPTPSEHQAAPRYYELRRSTPGGAFSIYDQATFSPDAGNPVTGLNRWMGSAAIDNQGNLVVGYSTSSPSVFPSVNFAGRAFNETGGLLQGEATIFAGLGSQILSGNRWGDYSALQLDPVDECTFWYVNEYYPVGDRNTNQFNFHTRVGKFKFAGCTPPARGAIAGKITDCVTGLPIVGAVVTASDGHSAASGADGTYSISVPPGNYTVGAADPFRNCNPAASQNVSVSNGGSATANFCLTGDAKLNLGPVTIDDSLGNHNNIVNRDECIKLTIGISNDGCIADSNISATLTTATPGVTINQALSAYPNLAVNASGTNVTPYAFTTSPSFGCGTPIDFTLNVTSAKQAPHALHFSLPTCAGGAPMSFSGNLAVGDTQQTARMGRDGNPSGCAVPKGCPGPLGAGPRLYDLFPFANNGGSTACLTVNLTAGCSPATNPIMAAGYLDSFNPANLCANYLGDPGGSPNPTNSFQVNVPAGHSLVLNVHEINPGLNGCSAYSGTVSGFFDDTPANGACPACVLSSTVTTSQLWPPNHNLINVGLAATSTGICPANRQVIVYSDEDDVDPQTSGDMSPDAKNVALGTLRLRSERRDSGSGADGRVYLIVTSTSDGTGNGAFACKTVTV
ncbi:MAG: carboxypeptidase-like regulatory domain-containing protein, partial [Thermoanaerobaculia bacterium]